MATSGGLSFTTALGLLFIGLKLGRVIDWDWVWVLAPLWGGVAIAAAILALLALFVLFTFIVKAFSNLS